MLLPLPIHVVLKSRSQSEAAGNETRYVHTHLCASDMMTSTARTRPKVEPACQANLHAWWSSLAGQTHAEKRIVWQSRYETTIYVRRPCCDFLETEQRCLDGELSCPHVHPRRKFYIIHGTQVKHWVLRLYLKCSNYTQPSAASL